jgi:hypothetical protein
MGRSSRTSMRESTHREKRCSNIGAGYCHDADTTVCGSNGQCTRNCRYERGSIAVHNRSRCRRNTQYDPVELAAIQKDMTGTTYVRARQVLPLQVAPLVQHTDPQHISPEAEPQQPPPEQQT